MRDWKRWEEAAVKNLGRNIIMMLFLSLSALAYGEIWIEADNASPAVGESFSLRVIMDSKDKYTLEGLRDIEVIGRYTTSSLSVVNGKRYTEYTETYNLIPVKAGTYSIQAVSGSERSNTVDINVGAGKSQTSLEDNYFIRTAPERERYYFGEKIPYEESLVILQNISDVGYVKYPDFKDMSVVDVNPGMRIGKLQKRTQVKGREALEIVLYQGILEPSSSGKRSIGGSVVRVASGGDRGFQRPRIYNLQGETRDIDVLPLPGGAPKGFKNTVGEVKAEVSLDRSELSPGEAATMTVILRGEGNLVEVDKLVGDPGPNFTVYENVVGEREWIEDGRYQNEKTYQIAFVPGRRGEYKTPEIDLPYFDTREGKYKTLKIEGRPLKVEGSAAETYIEPSQVPESSRIEVSILPQSEEEKESPILLYVLAGIVVIQGGVILYLLRGKLVRRRGGDLLIRIRRARGDDEVYGSYCEYMKSVYGFNPKAHSGERLKEEDLQELNSDIEGRRFRKEKLDRKHIYEVLKSKER